MIRGPSVPGIRSMSKKGSAPTWAPTPRGEKLAVLLRTRAVKLKLKFLTCVTVTVPGPTHVAPPFCPPTIDHCVWIV
jgi:hypothetical protein